MDQFTSAHLRELLEHRGGRCVSVFMPTHPGSRDIREDPVRFKNLLGGAEEELIAGGMRSSDARAVVEPARELEGNGGFWNRQSDGLVLYAAPNFFRWWRLPLRVDEQLTVNDRFHVKPLLELLQDDGRFYLLSVSQKNVRLFQGTHYSVAEMTPESLPKNLRDALNIDEYGESLQLHSANPTQGGNNGGRRPVMFFGHGGNDLDERKERELREYFRQINRSLQEFIPDDRTPLVFAGVEYLFPIFRESSKYRFLVPEPLRGSPDLLDGKALHDKAWSLVKPYFRERRDVAVRRFHDAVGAHLTANDIHEIIKGVWMGAVDALFVDRKATIFGTVDEQNGELREIDETGFQSEDLVDYAAARTLMGNGTVYLMEDETVPGGGPISALFRFPVPASEAPTRLL